MSHYLLPLILDILSHKPSSSETADSLLRELRKKLKSKGLATNNVKKQLEKTFEVCTDLGILTIVNEEVFIPFLSKEKKNTTKNSSDADKDKQRSKSAPVKETKHGENKPKKSSSSKEDLAATSKDFTEPPSNQKRSGSTRPSAQRRTRNRSESEETRSRSRKRRR